MATSYGDLENRDGTIFNKKTGKGYKNPATLATDLGVAPHEINWGNIGAWTPPAATPSAPASPVSPATPAQPTPTPSTPITPTTPTQTVPTASTPTPTQANYSGLVNKGGTIYLGDKAFSTPQELAQHLGIQSHQIDWGQIQEEQAEPTTVTTSDQLRAEQEEESLPYVKYADSNDVYDKDGNHITAEKAAEIPDFWNQVQMSGEGKPEGLMTPMESIQSVFGEEWQPAAIFDQLGLTQQGILGAVKIGDSVYTLGPGGSEMSPESYQAMFGRDISDTAGIAGEVDIATAIKLGIEVTSTQILAPIDPLDVWEKLKNEGKADLDKLQKTVNDAMVSLIDSMKSFGEDKAEAKEEAKDELGIDEKSQAIADAQKVRDDHYNMYVGLINDERFKGQSMGQIIGRQAKLKSQRAIEMAPLDSTLFIAQGNYDRAMDSLDDWSDDYNESMKFQMQAAQLNIDMVQGNLDREQQSQLEDAKIKFSMWQNEQNRNLDTQQEVKKLMLMYPEAGVTISDSWEDAYRKISPHVKSEKDFAQSIKDLELKIKQKSLLGGGGSYAPSAAKKLWSELGGETGTGMTFNEWYNSEQGEGDTPTTLEDIQSKTADFLGNLKNSGQLDDNNWRYYITGAMRDAGFDPTDQGSYDYFEQKIKQLMTGSSSSNYDSNIFSSSSAMQSSVFSQN